MPDQISHAALIRAAHKTILLVDSSKFDSTAAMRVAGVDSVQTVITDSNIERTHVRDLERLGVEVRIVDVSAPAESDADHEAPLHGG